ncbi:MAG: type I 3-dehydroquinate dehydratase, partial [Lysinibacillus sp.]
KLREIFAEELLLFTFRSHKEGGNKEISDAFYVELNQTAIRTKNIDLVDVELFNEEENVKTLVATAKENGVYVIMSNHDFFKTPAKEEIISRLCKMQEYGAHIPKIAVMPTSVADVITLLDATNTMKTEHADRPLITMSMGGTGVISRLAGEVFGSAFTFGAGKEASAPGQIPVEELRTVLNILHKSL